MRPNTFCLVDTPCCDAFCAPALVCSSSRTNCLRLCKSPTWQPTHDHKKLVCAQVCHGMILCDELLRNRLIWGQFQPYFGQRRRNLAKAARNRETLPKSGPRLTDVAPNGTKFGLGSTEFSKFALNAPWKRKENLLVRSGPDIKSLYGETDPRRRPLALNIQTACVPEAHTKRTSYRAISGLPHPGPNRRARCKSRELSTPTGADGQTAGRKSRCAVQSSAGSCLYTLPPRRAPQSELAGRATR